MLSKSENDVLNYLRTGLSNKEIAGQLFVGEKTIKFHCTNIFKKLNVKTRSELIAKQNSVYQPEIKREHFMPHTNEIILPNQQDKRNTGQLQKSQEDKIMFIDEKFRVGDTINQLHLMMKEVTKKDLNPNTVNAACNCVARLNETINTAIQAARFLNDR